MTDKQITEMTASPSERERSPEEPPSRFTTGKGLAVIAVALLVAVTVMTWRTAIASALSPVITVWRTLTNRGSEADKFITLSGRIEGDDSGVATKTAGRVLEIRVREGDNVNEGEILAVLDDQQVRAREDQARGAVEGAEARARAAQAQIAVLQEQLQQNQLLTVQAEVDAEGRVNQAQADLAAAEADLARQEASFRLASFDREAYTRLAESGAVSERQGKQAVATADQEEAAVAASKRRVEAARGALTTASANLSNAGIRGTQTAAVQKQIAQQQAEIVSATASAAQARAQLVEAQANLQDLTVRAPFNGTVMTRTAEPGEVIQAGTVIVTLLDLTKVYLRGFVPEGQIGRVKIGQAARVYLDSKPDQPVEAYVLRIDPQATFTPENTYFRDDRVKQVVGVKLQLKGATGFAKPGMPSDAEILTSGDIWPATGSKK